MYIYTVIYNQLLVNHRRMYQRSLVQTKAQLCKSPKSNPDSVGNGKNMNELIDTW